MVAGTASALATLLAGGQIPTAVTLRAAPWWSYLGGLIVAFYVFTITFLAPRLIFASCARRPGAKAPTAKTTANIERMLKLP